MTSHTLSTCVWNPRDSSPKKKPLGTGSFSTPPGSAITSTDFLSGENVHNTRSAIPCAPRFTGVTVTTGARCVVSAVVSFLEESTRHPVRAIDVRTAKLTGVLGTHQITPASLRAVECPVGTIEKVFRGLDSRDRKIGDPDANREAQRLALADVERVRLDLVAQPLRKRDGAGLARLGYRDHKLVATVTSDRVDTARRARKQERDFDQYLVPGKMAIGVVYFLEGVDVDHQNAQGRVVPAHALDFGGELGEESASIKQLGERIGARERFEANVVGLRHFHHMCPAHRVHRAFDHGLRELDVGVVE